MSVNIEQIKPTVACRTDLHRESSSQAPVNMFQLRI